MIALLEVMQLPIVSTCVGGIPEMVIHSQTGYIGPPSDQIRLSEAMYQLLEDSQSRKQMGKAGRVCVEQQFSSDKTLVEIMNIHASLLAPSGR